MDPRNVLSVFDIGDRANCSPLSAEELMVSRPYFTYTLREIEGHIGVDTAAVDLGCGQDIGDLRLPQSFGYSECIGVDILEEFTVAPSRVRIRQDVWTS